MIHNSIDDAVNHTIYECLNPLKPKSFFLFAGAGSGKTGSLVDVLKIFKEKHGSDYKLYRQKIAIITYTNAAADEIRHRLGNESIFKVSTIHSFAWDLIKTLTKDIKVWLKKNLEDEIMDLEDAQSRSRNLNNKTSIDRARKIDSKKKRMSNLDIICKFVYNPNGDNNTKDSLNHTEVISVAAEFISTKDLMQDIMVSTYPIILIDESQDTKKEMIDALFKLQANNKHRFSIGLFGDMMQRIYGEGKEDLGMNLPEDWLTPSKKINHRSDKRIVDLINNIRKDVDAQEQLPRAEKEDGFVRLFICKRESNKIDAEKLVAEKMAKLTGDLLWNLESGEVMTLILEHHMAAKRLGFLDLFEPLYKQNELKNGLLDGTLSGLNLFTKIILPLVKANQSKDKFSVARTVKKYSRLLEKDALIAGTEQLENLKKVNKFADDLLSLWNGNDPKLIEILYKLKETSLFPIPNTLNIIISRTNEEIKVIELEKEQMEDEDITEDKDSIINAWDIALQTPFSQIEKYDDYFSENSKFDTHQGVKGLQYERVMVIIDDEEARGFMFSYDKLFGTKELTDNDQQNIADGKETGVDRTRRLFYVACSRAKKSLAIVAYTDQQNLVKDNAIKYGWFQEEEIELL